MRCQNQCRIITKAYNKTDEASCHIIDDLQSTVRKFSQTLQLFMHHSWMGVLLMAFLSSVLLAFASGRQIPHRGLVTVSEDDQPAAEKGKVQVAICMYLCTVANDECLLKSCHNLNRIRRHCLDTCEPDFAKCRRSCYKDVYRKMYYTFA